MARERRRGTGAPLTRSTLVRCPAVQQTVVWHPSDE